jgi:hypothetical protein
MWQSASRVAIPACHVTRMLPHSTRCFLTPSSEQQVVEKLVPSACFWRNLGARVLLSPGLKQEEQAMGQARDRWQVGDRVRTCRYVLGLPLGSLGTIEQVLPFGGLYDVRFDMLTEPHILQRRALELASTADYACEAEPQSS